MKYTIDVVQHMSEVEEKDDKINQNNCYPCPDYSYAYQNITSSGETSYEFEESPLLQLTRFMNQPEKGIGLVSKQKISKSSICMTNTSVATVVVGWKKMDVCHNCYQRIKKSAKFHATYRYLPYCSFECLQCQDHFLNTCGPAILQIVADASKIVAKQNATSNATDSLSSFLPASSEEANALVDSTNGNHAMKQEAAIETQLLALTLLYNLSISTDITEINQILSIFQLYDKLPVNKDDTKLLSTNFYATLLTTLPDFIRNITFYFNDFDLKLIERLFRIIRLNSQPMPCYGLKQAVLLCLLPQLARVNHSCIPNCTLVLELEDVNMMKARKPVIHNVQSFVNHSQQQQQQQGSSNSNSNDPNTPSSQQQQQSSSVSPRPRPNPPPLINPAACTLRKVKISLLVIQEVIAQEELTVSYLSNLCIPCPERRNLLSQGFHFHCLCEKCLLESMTNETASTAVTAAAVEEEGSAVSKVCSRWKHNQSLVLIPKMHSLQDQLDSLLQDEMFATPLSFASTASSAAASAASMYLGGTEGGAQGGGTGTTTARALLSQYERMLTLAEEMIAVMKKLQMHEQMIDLNSYYTANSTDSGAISTSRSHVTCPYTLPFAWSPSTTYDIALLTIEDYQSKFRQLEYHWKDYIAYGMIFVRAGMIIRDCWTLAGSTTKIMRLDFMVNTCIHCTLMAKTYLDHERTSFPIDLIMFYVKQCLSFTVEANVIIDSVYLTNELHREHESEVALEDLYAVCDTWHYMRIIRDKAVRVRSYLKIMLERLQKEKDNNGNGHHHSHSHSHSPK